MTYSAPLPITTILADIRDALRRETRLVVQAPPGAGKTTVVPLDLIDEPWLGGRKILMLEPRRLAARAAARRMADMSGTGLGSLAGYRTRFDSRAGAHTRIEVLTDGVLIRMLQADPELTAAGLVIFDEFHERSLQADLALALLRDAQQGLRPDMRMIVMSATLDAAALARALQAPVLTAEGRVHPVETRYRDAPLQHDPAQEAAREVVGVLRAEEGSVLVFLPGAFEIRRAAAMLAGSVPADVQVVPLYGNLSRDRQDRAIVPPAPGTRKVVLATSIAETSLTIEGVRVVIDCGLARVPRYDPGVDMTRLATVAVSRAAADQRRGRAGRSEPGLCIRLWNRARDSSLPACYEPEIKHADLASCALELALWGVADPERLAWITTPPAGPFKRARRLLHRLGALDGRGHITAAGRRMAGMGLHPRLAYMLHRAREIGLGALACDLAALLGERDVLRFASGAYDADIRLRLEALHAVAATGRYAADTCTADTAACRTVLGTAKVLRKRLGEGTGACGDIEAAGVLLAYAFPDRIARKRGDREYLLSCGRGAFFGSVDALCAQDYLAVAALDGGSRNARMFLAAPLGIELIVEHFEEHIREEERLEWDAPSRSVIAERVRCLGRLVLRRESCPRPDPARVRAALLAGIQSLGIGALPWNDAVRQVQARIMLLRDALGPERWPDVSDAWLAAHLSVWLEPFLGTCRSLAQIKTGDLQDALLAMLPAGGHAALDELAPRTVSLPGGRRARLQYRPGAEPPVLAVRIQDLFGLHETPRVAAGRVQVLLHLLSPAQRPVQITTDLDGFWKNSYHAVKKELKGRYPKHSWPDDPLQEVSVPKGKRK